MASKQQLPLGLGFAILASFQWTERLQEDKSTVTAPSTFKCCLSGFAFDLSL